jgi:hypothetical protein
MLSDVLRAYTESNLDLAKRSCEGGKNLKSTRLKP